MSLKYEPSTGGGAVWPGYFGNGLGTLYAYTKVTILWAFIAKS